MVFDHTFTLDFLLISSARTFSSLLPQDNGEVICSSWSWTPRASHLSSIQYGTAFQTLTCSENILKLFNKNFTIEITKSFEVYVPVYSSRRIYFCITYFNYYLFYCSKHVYTIKLLYNINKRQGRDL